MKHYPDYLEELVEKKLDSYVHDGSWKSWSKETAIYFSKTGEMCTVYNAKVK